MRAVDDASIDNHPWQKVVEQNQLHAVPLVAQTDAEIGLSSILAETRALSERLFASDGEVLGLAAS